MAVTEFGFTVFAKTRNEATEEMDAITLQILQIVGGEPWVAFDDDVTRKATTPNPVSEDDFYYVGRKRMFFKGPINIMEQLPFHDGFRPQEDT